MKKNSIILCLFMIIFFLCGCSYSNISIMNMESAAEGCIKKSSVYWSGIQKGHKIYLDEGDEINFYIEMEKGSVTFSLKDIDNKEVFSLTKEDEFKGNEIYKAQESGILWLIEKGENFKGKYEIRWGEKEDKNSEE